MSEKLLEVENLNVYYGAIHALKGISFHLDKGEIVAVGTHKELISSSPLYKEIFASQLGGLRKEDVS